MAHYGFFVGRLNPIHLGHEQIIAHMIKACGVEHSTIILGSCNAPTSVRHFFSYTERREFIRQLFPDINFVGIPDYPTDEEWMLAIRDLIETIIDGESATVLFFGGADEDLQLFIDAGHKVSKLDRFSGVTPVISATEVRDHLLHDQSLDGLVNPKIAPTVQKLFRERWEKFKKI